MSKGEKVTTATVQLTDKNPPAWAKFTLSEYHENKNHTSLGNYGEIYVKNFLIESGYFVQICASERHSGDLRILDTLTGEIFQVEVKTAYCDYKGRYGFCLRKQKHTDITYSDFVILLCIDKYCSNYMYVVPSSLMGQQYFSITSHPIKYKGKYSCFIVNDKVNFEITREIARLW